MSTNKHRALRDAMGHFPTGVVIVTAPAGRGEDPIAITVSSFNTVSLDPPLILFCVNRDALSLPALLRAPHFAISVLQSDQQHLSNRFAAQGGDKWAGIEPVLSEAGCPGIGPCLARFECAPFATYDGGDHVILVGRVMEFDRSDQGEPLLFFRGGYHSIAPSRQERRSGDSVQ